MSGPECKGGELDVIELPRLGLAFRAYSETAARSCALRCVYALCFMLWWSVSGLTHASGSVVVCFRVGSCGSGALHFLLSAALRAPPLDAAADRRPLTSSTRFPTHPPTLSGVTSTRVSSSQPAEATPPPPPPCAASLTRCAPHCAPIVSSVVLLRHLAAFHALRCIQRAENRAEWWGFRDVVNTQAKARKR